MYVKFNSFEVQMMDRLESLQASNVKAIIIDLSLLKIVVKNLTE